MRSALTATALALLSLTVIVVAQNQTLKFEVASVKPSKAADSSYYGGCYSPSARVDIAPRGMCIAHNETLRTIIADAYGVSIFEVQDKIIGGPSWIGTDRFEIEGKAADPSTTTDDLSKMLRNLLAERFKLQVHEETKDASGYALVIAKSGAMVKLTSGDKPRSIAAFGQPANELEGWNASMSDLAAYFVRQFHRPFVDQTGLMGRYDFDLKLLTGEQVSTPAREPRSGGRTVYGLNDSDLPAISKAMQDQLGLRLQAEKLPVTRFVIDHAEKADAN